MAASLVFALPGDPESLTGGYIYDKRLIQDLAKIGWDVELLLLGNGFPNPSAATMDAAFAALSRVSESNVLIVDGLAYGALDPARVPEISAPILALTHHPLGLEDGLPPERAAALLQSERLNLAQARHVVVTSPATAATLTADFNVPAHKLTVALPGIDRPEMPARRTAGPARLLSVGTLIRRKGHDVLLGALARIADLEWQMDIVGGNRDAAVAANLMTQSAALGLQDRVSFRGEVELSEIQSLYRNAKLFALASRYEGYGMVFAEAISWGLPIVACAAGAVPETVPKTVGLLTPPDDPEAFAVALRRLLMNADDYDRLESGARAAAARLPAWADAAAAVDRALRSMHAGAPG